MPPIRTVEEILSARLSSEDQAACAALMELAWPPGSLDSKMQHVSPSGPALAVPHCLRRQARTFIAREGKSIVARASFSPRQIAIEGQTRIVLALAGVVSHPSVRGQGYGQAVVRAALAYVDNQAFDVAYFQTNHAARGFYEHLGGRIVDNPLKNSLAADPARSPFWDDIQMVYPAHAMWPGGVVDTLGPGW